MNLFHKEVKVVNILMHLGLSQAIRSAIEKEFDFKMDAFSFMFGNIKPDLKSSSTGIPHFKPTAMNLVQAEIENLTALRLNKSRKCSKHLSESIGVITHYLSDFFCYAHTEYFKDKKLSHLLYEFQLLNYFQKNLENITCQCSVKSEDIPTSSRNIITYIEEAHDSYLKKIKENILLPFELDTIHALLVSTFVCASIISICLDLNLKVAI